MNNEQVNKHVNEQVNVNTSRFTVAEMFREFSTLVNAYHPDICCDCKISAVMAMIEVQYKFDRLEMGFEFAASDCDHSEED